MECRDARDDVGNPRHSSHQNGKDVDISLYGFDGLCEWRSYCNAVNTGNGRECQLGSETAPRRQPRPTHSPPLCCRSFRTASTCKHWPNHDNHIHVRLSETP